MPPESAVVYGDNGGDVAAHEVIHAWVQDKFGLDAYTSKKANEALTNMLTAYTGDSIGGWEHAEKTYAATTESEHPQQMRADMRFLSDRLNRVYKAETGKDYEQRGGYRFNDPYWDNLKPSPMAHELAEMLDNY